MQIRDRQIWIDLSAQVDPVAHHCQRLQDGLEQGIPLVIGKSVIALLKHEKHIPEAFQMGLDFGVSYRQSGWDTGLTIHTCMMNLLPYLDQEDKSRAIYHGLAAVARDTSNQPPRFPIQPLPINPAMIEIAF